MTKVLITGASGFIGKALTEYLLANGLGGEQIEIYCWLRDASKLDAEIKPRLKFIEDDLINASKHSELIQQFDYVFHIAAQASVSSKMAGYQNNIDSTKALIETLKSSKTLKRIVFTSSIGAVDRCRDDDCQFPLTEESQANPLTLYGKSKLDCEKLFLDAGLNYTIVRPTWIYGPGMRLDSHLATFLQKIKSNSPIFKFAFPAKVSVMYIDDLLASLVHLALYPQGNKQIFFASDNQDISLAQIFKTFGEIVGRKTACIKLPNFFQNILKSIRPNLPFQLQCLFSNVLFASAKKLEDSGFKSNCNFRRGAIKTTRWFALEQKLNKDLPLALITGGSSGIGLALAEQLYCQGFNLILLDKSPCAESLSGLPDIKHFQIDLTNNGEIQQVLEKLSGDINSIDLLINCAGIGARGLFCDLPLVQQKKIVELNINAVLALIHGILNARESTNKLKIINIASSAAFQPLPYMAIYAASKAFIFSFSQALSAELKDSNIEVSVICPPGTNTNFQNASGVKKNSKEKLLSPAEVAAKIIKTVPISEPCVYIGSRTYLMSLASRLLARKTQIALWQKLMSNLR